MSIPTGRQTETRISLLPQSIEPLWVAALALFIILPGYQFGAAVIRFFGRGGQTETVEWLTYLAVLVCLPAAAFIASRFIFPVSIKAERALKTAFLLVLAAEILVYLLRADWISIVAALLMSLVTVAVVSDVERRSSGPAIIVGTAAWMSAGSLVSWTNAVPWYTQSLSRIAVFAATTAISLLAVRATFRASGPERKRSLAETGLFFLSVAILIVLSFRTYPVLEFYHWEAYVGPMQELRQGGWLLWDAPAQYGVLSILIPTLFPGNAWQSFYIFQALCNVAVALLMFWGIGGTRASASRIVLAAALTATTLFFRPRTATLLLAGQMTPSGGPVRFIWPFMMLAFLFVHYRRATKSESSEVALDSRFEIVGHLIWLGSLCWSVEAAIYCGAVWFPAYALLLIAKRPNLRIILRSIAAPIGGVLLLVLAASVFYKIALGHLPDWMSYLEYALLYSGGFHSLPIDPSGSVWFLLIIFLGISTAAVIYTFRDPSNSAALVLAGAWGGVWAISSYFVSRSHPANLLSIATFLVFAAAISLQVIADQPREEWHALIRVAFVPIFALPVALTIGHPAFVSEITRPQLSYSTFTEQIPLMEPSLNSLLLEAGAKPSDPVVRIGDGRLMLPAWRPRDPNGRRVVSPYSWLPKQYEIIGTLPADRRQKYIDRMAEHLHLSGWLVHSKAHYTPDFTNQIADIQRTHVETKRFENSDWIVSWYQIKR